MDKEENKIQGNFISYDSKGTKRAAFVHGSDKALFETASELFEAAKELIAGLEDAEDDRDDEGNVYADVLRVREAIGRIEGGKRGGHEQRVKKRFL
jgi:hypothetical protein